MGIDNTVRWITFRNTPGFVADGPEQTMMSVDGSGNVNTYPTALLIGNSTVNCGSELQTLATQDRASGNDARLAGNCSFTQDGVNFANFRVDLPATGLYNVYISAGDTAAAANQFIQVYDTNTLIATPVNSGGGSGAGQYYDALTLRSSAAVWLANLTPVRGNFATTILRIRVGKAAFASGKAFLNVVGIQAVTANTAVVTGFG